MDFLRVSGDPEQVIADLRSWLAVLPAETGVFPDLVIETSGSSGTPKQVRLSRSALRASVAASAARLGATGPWVLALPPTYVAGVQVVLRSLVAGHEPTLLERDGWPPGEGWFVSLVPTQLTRMLEDEDDVAALRRAHTVLLGGGPIDQALRARAEAAGVHVVATYGSAETAGGCVYDGVPLDGVALALGEGGRIRIAGPTLFTEYVDQPDLTREVLADGWFRTSDAGRVDADGRLQVIGRVDDVILSGGLNVPGPAVAERLRAHPDVVAAEVLGVPDEEWGHRVVAFVALEVRGALRGSQARTSGQAPKTLETTTAGPAGGGFEGGAAGDPRAPTTGVETELRDWVAAVHPRAWAPRQVVVLDALPLLPNGKPDRQALRGLALASRVPENADIDGLRHTRRRDGGAR